jgi:hypothetical protein
LKAPDLPLLPAQPTLLACERVSPDFVHMAVEELDCTIHHWSDLEKQGVR